ncbi:MAG: ATP-dependent Clp protease ATP-binding subunit [Clostridia bacterium]|nr:ATP-dependent Clp protease ATP-binding subunit [Clostridia bacterium]
MVMCSRCRKRMAVVFITRVEGDESKQEGICIKCAKELGIKPINDIISKMGLSDEDVERMSEEMADIMDGVENGGDPLGLGDMTALEASGDESDAPAVDFGKLMKEGMGMFMSASGDKSEGKKQKKGEEAPGAHKKKEKKFLTTYCQNITEKAAMGKLDRVVGRQRELDRIIQILCRRQKNNPCLIGEPGVGKTAIAEALAQKIAEGDVPYKLRNKELYLVDLTALVAGTQFRGQFESRVLGLLNEVKAAGNIILIIDEVHNIVGAGDAEGSMNAANIMKPALSRGEIQVIGATTLNEYRKYIEKDSALERRFQPVTVAEPGIEDTRKVLEGIKHYYEEFHLIKIPDRVLKSAVVLSERYITDRYLPDKAIDLLDEAASHISLNSPEINERCELADRLTEIDKQRNRLEAQAEKNENAEEAYKQLADLKVEELRLKGRLNELKALIDEVEMTEEDLANVIEIWTGIPATTINEDEYARLEGLSERLKERIVGQDEAVDAVVRAVRRSRTGISPKKKPVSFIFAGPTGVGKTELVKVLANDLFSSPETLIRLDMSEFMDKFSVSRIVGAPPGYVGYDDGGQLTEKIRRRPYSVVLFDEIEKAHPDVMNILLQILDDGRITDAHGKTVSFENTVIVMTTNAGSAGTSSAAGFADIGQTRNRDKTVKALSDFLRPEFLNRVDEIITFNSLEAEDFKGIARIMLSDLAKALEEKFIRLSYTDAAAERIAKDSYSVKFGARNMRRYIQTSVEDKIAEKIVETHGAVTAVSIDADENGLVIAAL